MGDSLISGSSTALWDRLDPGHRASIRGIPGSRIGQHDAAVDAYVVAVTDHVVFNLGTNDAQLSWPVEQSAADLVDLVGRVESVPCVHLTTVNTHKPGDPGYEARARAVNEQIRSVVAAKPTMRLIDWDAEVGGAEDPTRLFQPDGIHWSVAGSERYAELVEASISSCVAGTRSPSEIEVLVPQAGGR